MVTTLVTNGAEHGGKPPVSLTQLWTDYVKTRVAAGFMRDGGKQQKIIVENLRKFLKHNDAAKITKKNIIDWRDYLMIEKAAKTVSDKYLSTVRTLLNWAVENDLLEQNAAATVKQPKPRKVYSRERGYTQEEAVKVLKASRCYEPNADENGYVREKPNLVAAKRWVPMICAFTGARVSEITQLRKEDIRKEGGMWVLRITPDAGTVKSGGYRDVPLHSQIVEAGFAEFVAQCADGPMFHNGVDPKTFEAKSKQASNQLADWLRIEKLRPEGMQPNHAWRHRFKTQCRELSVSDQVSDAIQGHTGRTASDNYGDVTLKAKADAIGLLPPYSLDQICR